SRGPAAPRPPAPGHAVRAGSHVARQVEYFTDYTRRYSDFPLLVLLKEHEGRTVPDRLVRAADLDGALGETNNPDWKCVGLDELSGELVAPLGASGHRWGEQGKWNLEEKDGKGRKIRLCTTMAGKEDEIVSVAFPYFGSIAPHDFVA